MKFIVKTSCFMLLIFGFNYESKTQVNRITENGVIDWNTSGISLIPFQGYNETTAQPGKLEFRIFYHTNGGNTQKVFNKPIIISDGFDPLDSRKIEASDYTIDKPYINGISVSIEDMMRYIDCNGAKENLINKLNAQGYDLIVVNYPKYVNPIGNDVDGGADFIERNAMNMIGLIQYMNNRLQAQGISEQLCIIGPSMGGQISRYALAYMEKMYAQTGNPVWLHKTRLWISIDSPHLGANIPLGTQTLVYQLAASSPKAQEFYNDWLNSPAAKQQLIELHSPTKAYYAAMNLQYFVPDPDQNFVNGRTISQGFATNSGSPFFQKYYNNQFSNGLPDSKGYPKNLRKIALTNGSLIGSTINYLRNSNGTIEYKSFGQPSEERLNIRGFARGINTLVAAIEGYNTPSYNSTAKISRVKQGLKDIDALFTNKNSRGSMDILPGGYFKDWEILTGTIMNSSVYLADISNYWIFDLNFSWNVDFELRKNAVLSSFIPTFSALGIKNPEQDWSKPLNRNLVCSGETPFDSYFGQEFNTQHTSFNCESVTWLLKELAGQPQVPYFPIGNKTITGKEEICLLNNIEQYTLDNPCDFPEGAIWSATNNLKIVKSSGYEARIEATSFGIGKLIATFQNGEKIEKTIVVGTPPISLTGSQISASNQPTLWKFWANPNIPYGDYYWNVKNGRIADLSENTMELLIPCKQFRNVQAEFRNSCGISFSNVVQTDLGNCVKRSGGILRFAVNNSLLNLNTLNIKVNVTGNDALNKLFSTEVPIVNELVKTVNIYTKKGELVTSYQPSSPTQQLSIDVTNLPQATYLIEVFGENDYKELHTFHYSLLNQEKQQLEAIALGNIDVGTIDQELRKYVLQQKLFSELQYNEELINNSPVLQDFSKQGGENSFGIIFLLENLLNNNELAKAQEIVESWDVKNTVDENYKNYYLIFFRFLNGEALSANDINTIHDIAIKCPLNSGDIVYAARSLYNYHATDDEDFTNTCSIFGLRGTSNEIINYSTPIGIYPNPTKGLLTIKLPENETCAKVITVTNTMGKQILQRVTYDKQIMLNLNVTPGLYIVQITNKQTGKSQTQKITIIK